MTPTAHYNSSKLCWEIWMEEAQGDRMAKVLKHAQTAYKELTDQGHRFVEARLGKMEMPMLLIIDPVYYTVNEQAMVDWAKQSNVQYKQTGMILEFDSQEDKMMFMLRWQ